MKITLDDLETIYNLTHSERVLDWGKASFKDDKDWNKKDAIWRYNGNYETPKHVY